MGDKRAAAPEVIVEQLLLVGGELGAFAVGARGAGVRCRGARRYVFRIADAFMITPAIVGGVALALTLTFRSEALCSLHQATRGTCASLVDAYDVFEPLLKISLVLSLLIVVVVFLEVNQHVGFKEGTETIFSERMLSAFREERVEAADDGGKRPVPTLWQELRAQPRHELGEGAVEDGLALGRNAQPVRYAEVAPATDRVFGGIGVVNALLGRKVFECDFEIAEGLLREGAGGDERGLKPAVLDSGWKGRTLTYSTDESESESNAGRGCGVRGGDGARVGVGDGGLGESGGGDRSDDADDDADGGDGEGSSSSVNTVARDAWPRVVRDWGTVGARRARIVGSVVGGTGKVGDVARENGGKSRTSVWKRVRSVRRVGGGSARSDVGGPTGCHASQGPGYDATQWPKKWVLGCITAGFE
ncbi:hypothetical protein B0H16DRAFT_1480147 [Mycena metata]|uniref:Uncharacterized protein n=1 Tax=Mycena metata TaxID=1033252 RepID=A0AAD7H4G5_9AGAR|nr:hypothetical protein B0H16DRAFT_1480147 [Mycena metata]